MDWLNYHHLLYFYTVAREGSVTKAAKQLQLAQPTLSSQIKKLEDSLGEELFERRGRRLVLTEMGTIAYKYAEEIFTLGGDMVDALQGTASDKPQKLVVGIADVIPKLVCHRVLATALELDPPVRLVIHEGKTPDLMAALALREYDMVLTDAPFDSSLRVKAFNHSLGDSGLSFFASPTLARRYRRGFPKSLDGAPMILPVKRTSLRDALDVWFQSIGVRPRIIVEVEDTALIKVFGQNGSGVFAVPTVISDEVRRAHGVHKVGETEEAREHFYAITVERRITHPAIAAIADEARRRILA